VISQKRVPNKGVVEYLSSYDVTRVAMEVSTRIAPLYRELELEGYDVVVSHPKKTRYIAEARIKTDRVDSKALADLLRLNALPTSYMPDERTAALREGVRRRAFLVRQRVKLKAKIRDVLAYRGIEETNFGLFTRKGVDFLRSLGLESVDCYLRVMVALNQEIARLSRS